MVEVYGYRAVRRENEELLSISSLCQGYKLHEIQVNVGDYVMLSKMREKQAIPNPNPNPYMPSTKL